MADSPIRAVDHARHDLELIARVAAGDGTTSDERAAAALRETCDECRSLGMDLRAIAAGTRAIRDLPSPAAPRDFRLSTGDAARLRRRGGAGLFGSRGHRASRGMGRFGGGLVAIGLVGLVFGSGLLGGLSGLGAGGAAVPAAAPAYRAYGTPAATALAEKDNASQGFILAPAPAPSSGRTVAAAPPGPSSAATAASGQDATAAARDASTPSPSGTPVIFVSAALLVVGLGLLVAARTSRRAGP